MIKLINSKLQNLRFSDSFVLDDPCASSGVSKSLFGALNYSSSAEFFVFTGVITFLFCLFSIFVYLFLWSKYTGDYRAAYIVRHEYLQVHIFFKLKIFIDIKKDLGATALLALFWFCGSCAWATDVTSLKVRMTWIHLQFDTICRDKWQEQIPGTN